jgi:antitoxin CptB
MSTDHSDSLETARLRYRCRRGMLELDALLTRFLSSPQFIQLSPVQRLAFEQLLEQPDPQLLSWFMGHEECGEAEWCVLILAIKNSNSTVE